MSNPVGRPSEYTQETADVICALLAQGWSLRKVIEQGEDEMGIKMPAIATVFKWMRDNEEFLKQYARAKQEAADAMAEEIMDIADAAPDAIMGVDRSDGARVQALKLQIDSRKWLMSKMKPKKYGDKLDLTSAGDKIQQAPLVVSSIKARDVTSQQETS